MKHEHGLHWDVLENVRFCASIIWAGTRHCGLSTIRYPCAAVLCGPVPAEGCKGLRVDINGCCMSCPPSCDKTLNSCPLPQSKDCKATFDPASCTCGVSCLVDSCTAIDCETCNQNSLCHWNAHWSETSALGVFKYGRCQKLAHEDSVSTPETCYSSSQTTS